MDSGFSMRVLVLLMMIGHQTMANVYRYSGRNLKPYLEQAQASPRSYKPASSYAGYSSASGSSEGSRPSQGLSGTYGRQVDGYSRQGSVSNYRPTSAASKPKQTSQQPPKVYYDPAPYDKSKFGSGIVSSGAIEIRDSVKPSPQLGPSSSVMQTKAGMWNLPSGTGVGSGVSNRPSGRYSAPKPVQEGFDSDPNIKMDHGSRRPSYTLNKQMPSSKPARQMPSSKPARQMPSSKPAQQTPTFKPATAGYYTIRKQSIRPATPVQQSIRPATPVQQSIRPATPVQQSIRPATPVQQMQAAKPPSGPHILQSSAGMWDLPKPFSSEKYRLSTSRAAEAYTTPKPYQNQPGSLSARVQQLRAGMRQSAPSSSRRLDEDQKSVSSFYSYEGQRPQLRSMHNKNRQPLTY